jgi:hypothetical protein
MIVDFKIKDTVPIPGFDPFHRTSLFQKEACYATQIPESITTPCINTIVLECFRVGSRKSGTSETGNY